MSESSVSEIAPGIFRVADTCDVYVIWPGREDVEVELTVGGRRDAGPEWPPMSA